MTTVAIAKLGQLYLDRGQWQGSQLLPAGWVDEAEPLGRVRLSELRMRR